jgi:hypothetical protein
MKLKEVAILDNQYQLDDIKKDTFVRIVRAFLREEIKDIDFTGSGINFYTLGEVLEELGYEKEDYDSNGWQLDLTVTYVKEDCENLILHGSAYVFEIQLAKNSHFEGEN